MMSRPQREGEAAEEANRKSALPSERVVLLVLCALLAAALIIIHRLSMMMANKSIQTLKEENEALGKNLSAMMMANKSIQTLKEENQALRKNLSDLTCLKCGRGWERHGGTCYSFPTIKSSWDDSRSLCRVLGGDLVKISSREEQEFLMRRVRSLSDEWKMFWIGLTDSQTEGSWFWVDGSPLNKSLSFWNSGEPNNWSKKSESENCGRMEKSDENLNNWNDFHCMKLSSIVCEKDPKSEQSSCV